MLLNLLSALAGDGRLLVHERQAHQFVDRKRFTETRDRGYQALILRGVDR